MIKQNEIQDPSNLALAPLIFFDSLRAGKLLCKNHGGKHPLTASSQRMRTVLIKIIRPLTGTYLDAIFPRGSVLTLLEAGDWTFLCSYVKPSLECILRCRHGP